MFAMPALLAAVFALLTPPAPIVCEATVAAKPAEVWRVWTTSDGMKEWLVADAKVELRQNGPFEVYFNANGEIGSRGSEGCRVLSWIPERMLSFTWNAPPTIPTIRNNKDHSFVVVELSPEGDGTHVKLTHDGWGDGGNWDKTRAYFDKAWPAVLGVLKERFVKGPAKWDPVSPKAAPKKNVYAILMNPARSTFINDATPEEQKIVSAHFVRLKQLTEEGQVILAGPTSEEVPTGLVIFEAPDMAAAEKFFNDDPAVKAGVFKGRVVPFNLALLRSR